MQRTDYAETFLERFVSIPLISENIFRCPNYLDKTTDKELVDLLLILKTEGIFISMKCQQDPQHRTGSSLILWGRKSAQAALRQVKGGNQNIQKPRLLVYPPTARTRFFQRKRHCSYSGYCYS